MTFEKNSSIPYKVQAAEQFLDATKRIYMQTYDIDPSKESAEDEFLESLSLMKEYLNDNEYSALHQESKEWSEKFSKDEKLKPAYQNLTHLQSYLRNLANIDEQITHIETTYVNNSENQIHPSMEDESEDNYNFLGDLETIRGRVNDGEYSYAAKDARRLKNLYNKHEPETNYVEEIPQSLDTVRKYLNAEQQSETNLTAKKH
ncbi:MAG: hypothetical protein ACLFTH_04250 [Candidatus Woesearchaeota archaeon]